MPKFGRTWFNGGPFGADELSYTAFNKSIRRIPLGMTVRKQIGKKLIFRCRRGNGHAGSIAGKHYQDKYKYFVPSSINNEEGQPARNALAQAVLNWQTIITQDQKKEYNRRAGKLKAMSGYNLYISEYIKGAL